MKKVYKTKGVCSREISFDLENGIVSNISFVGGCSGNLKAIGKLCNGMEAMQIVNVLKGNVCGSKTTSCADQLAIAIAEAVKE